jgi:hypothetical protein
MSVHGSSPLFNLDVDQCHVILEETIALLLLSDQRYPLPSTAVKLRSLLHEHFQDDASGQSFRSMIIYGRPDGATVTVSHFNKYVMLPRTSYTFELQPNLTTLAPIRISKTARAQLNKNTLLLGHDMVEFVLNFVSSTHPRNSELAFFLKRTIPQKWFNGIIGKHNRQTLHPLQLPSMFIIQSRIQRAIEYSFLQKTSNPSSHFFSEASGVSWQPSVPDIIGTDYEKATLEAVSLFSGYLDRVLSDSKKTLDQLAGVVVDVLHPHVVRSLSRLLKQAPPPSVQKLDLKLGPGPDAEHGGTVIAIHQHLSPQFLAYYLVDHDSACTYMQDIRSAHKKDRKIRVASTHHVSTHPIWIQFGNDSNTYLYLSRKVSAAEEKWLLIVNFVMKLLVDFVNAHIKRVSQRPVPSENLMRIRRYCTVVENTGNPRNGNYGRHHDAKPGLVDPSDPRFSRFQLMVPTLCLQNHSVANTCISWYPNDFPKWCAGTVTQELFLFHIQCLGVQEHFQHEVCYAFFLYPVIVLFLTTFLTIHTFYCNCSFTN